MSVNVCSLDMHINIVEGYRFNNNIDCSVCSNTKPLSCYELKPDTLTAIYGRTWALDIDGISGRINNPTLSLSLSLIFFFSFFLKKKIKNKIQA